MNTSLTTKHTLTNKTSNESSDRKSFDGTDGMMFHKGMSETSRFFTGCLIAYTQIISSSR